MHVHLHPAQSIFRLPRIVLFLTLLCLCAFAAACSDSDPVSPQADDSLTPSLGKMQTRYIAILNEGQDLKVFNEDPTLELVYFYPSTRLAVFDGKNNVNQNLVDSATETFNEASSANRADPGDLLMGFQEAFDFSEAADQDNFSHIEWPTVHEYALGAGIKIAILDSGAAFEHPYLQYRLVDLGVAELPSADESFEPGDDPDNPEGAWGHGTHVAGIIAATAPGAILWPIPVLSPEGPSTSVEVAIGLQAAFDNGADIVNLSLRLEGHDETIEELLRQLSEAGIHILAAAGNDGADSPVYPAKSGYTVAVAMVDSNDVLDDKSAYGPLVELAAPGIEISSAWPTENYVKGFRVGTGTSMACASASGALACIMGPHDRARPSPPMERLLETAAPIVPDPMQIVNGRISPMNALMLMPVVGF